MYPNGTAAKTALPTSKIAPIRPPPGRRASNNPTVAYATVTTRMPVMAA